MISQSCNDIPNLKLVNHAKIIKINVETYISRKYHEIFLFYIFVLFNYMIIARRFNSICAYEQINL